MCYFIKKISFFKMKFLKIEVDFILGQKNHKMDVAFLIKLLNSNNYFLYLALDIKKILLALCINKLVTIPTLNIINSCSYNALVSENIDYWKQLWITFIST